MKKKMLPYLLGVRAGYASPVDLSGGLTFDNDPDSERSQAFDRGANLGQLLGRFILSAKNYLP